MTGNEKDFIDLNTLLCDWIADGKWDYQGKWDANEYVELDWFMLQVFDYIDPELKFSSFKVEAMKELIAEFNVAIRQGDFSINKFFGPHGLALWKAKLAQKNLLPSV